GKTRSQTKKKLTMPHGTSRAMQVFTDARVYGYDPLARTYTRFDALVVDRGRIRGMRADQTGGGVERISLNGATVLPAFGDCHVHLTDTGHFLSERNINGARSYGEFAAMVERLPAESVILAGQYDESFWNDGR